MASYTGIGARLTPLQIKNLMTEIGMYMNAHGWTLRSGGADGADSAFEIGAGDKKQIFLPYKGFNNNDSSWYIGSAKVDDRAEELAHRVWDDRWQMGMVKVPWRDLKQSTKAFMTRNMYQLCGANLGEMSKVVICWTKDGTAVGGTGQALHAVEMMRQKQEGKPPEERKEVPQVLNLYYPSTVEFIRDVLRNNLEPGNLWP